MRMENSWKCKTQGSKFNVYPDSSCQTFIVAFRITVTGDKNVRMSSVAKYPICMLQSHPAPHRHTFVAGKQQQTVGLSLHHAVPVEICGPAGWEGGEFYPGRAPGIPRVGLGVHRVSNRGHVKNQMSNTTHCDGAMSQISP